MIHFKAEGQRQTKAVTVSQLNQRLGEQKSKVLAAESHVYYILCRDSRKEEEEEWPGCLLDQQTQLVSSEVNVTFPEALHWQANSAAAGCTAIKCMSLDFMR